MDSVEVIKTESDEFEIKPEVDDPIPIDYTQQIEQNTTRENPIKDEKPLNILEIDISNVCIKIEQEETTPKDSDYEIEVSVIPCEEIQSKSNSNTVKEYLKKHISDTKKYKSKRKLVQAPCNLCGRVFSIQSSLKKHMRFCSKVCKCCVCYEEFPNKNLLKSHMIIHTECNVCHKFFAQKCNLIKHMKIHTGTKNYICDICNTACTQKSSLIRHMNVHTGTRNHICPVCNKAFAEKGTLSNHMNIHTCTKNYICTFCTKAFTQKSSLIKHTNIHTGTKNYICFICNKAFTEVGTLNNHMNIHTGTKNYKCDICGKAFTQKSTLNKHYLTIHSISS